MDQQKINEIMERINNDKRSKNEVFKGIANLLVDEHNVPEEQSIEAARNLIGFYEAILKMTPHEDGTVEEVLKF